jgi:hypothetical protein
MKGLVEIAIALAVGGCHATPATSTPSNTDSRVVAADFCGAMKSSKDAAPASIHAATTAMHDALVASGASEHADATTELVAWLHAQACVTSVEPDTAVIDTEPAIRTIKIRVAVSGGITNSCTAELTLAPGAKLSMACKSLIDI